MNHFCWFIFKKGDYLWSKWHFKLVPFQREWGRTPFNDSILFRSRGSFDLTKLLFQPGSFYLFISFNNTDLNFVSNSNYHCRVDSALQGQCSNQYTTERGNEQLTLFDTFGDRINSDLFWGAIKEVTNHHFCDFQNSLIPTPGCSDDA